ncbi:MAG: signal peptidase I [Desulfosalsimonadaceae bacterium]
MKKHTKRSEPDTTSRKKSRLRENVEAILIAILLALFIRTFIVQAFKIPSGSMKPTLQIGDHILVNKFTYGVDLPFTDVTIIPGGRPERGDIIVFEYPVEPDKDFIKRVIGIPGDVVEIRDKTVYVNGEPIDQGYTMHTEANVIPAEKNARDNFGPVKVPENEYFVLGDNRDNSYDSRFWGFVEEETIKGEAFIIYWSWDSEQFWPRWSRLAQILR